MTTTLRLASDLELPVRAVTETLGIYGRRGSGKSYGATKLAELMLTANAQIVALDPVGVWWGLRLAADGKSPGFEIPVFGGLHGDVPLEPTAGKLIADLVVDRGISVVLDVSQFEHDTDKARFAADFADRFFFRKKSAPSAVHVFLEECQEFVPQNTQRGEERMLHVWQRLIRLGRNFGIGATMISQRPQDVNTKVRNQAELLLAFQLTGTHERKAIAEWMKDKGLDQDLVDSLPKLTVGHAQAWSPAWLKISKVVHVAKKETFDASSTPTVGARAQVRELAPIDLEKLRDAMAKTIERAKAEDPKALQKRVRELEAALAKQAKPAPAAAIDVRARPNAENTRLRKALEAAVQFIIKINASNFDVAGVDKAELERAIQAAMGKATDIVDRRLEARAKQLDAVRLEAQRIAAKLKAILGDVDDVVVSVDVTKNEPFSVTPPPARRSARAPAKPAASPRTIIGDARVSRPQQRMLDALASFEALGIQRLAVSHLAVFSDQSSRSSGFDKNKSTLRTMGLIDYPTPGEVALTDAGRSIAAADAPPATLDQLHDAWCSKVSGPQARMLSQLVRVYPDAMDRGALADLTSQSGTSSGWDKNLSTLRSLGLIDYPDRQHVIATDLLFPEGLR